MSDAVQELHHSIEIYADNLSYLNAETESSEIVHMLVVRDHIEEFLQAVPVSVAVNANVLLLDLDRELVEKKLHVIDVTRDMGKDMGKPVNHWWWYLSLTIEEQKVAS